MGKILTEITPLAENDCIYVVDRHKQKFDFPIHNHKEYELNFISNCKGNRRVVGDSYEKLDFYDLVIIGGNLEHGWIQDPECDDRDKTMREITIQWEGAMLREETLSKTQFLSLKEMLQIKARNGIAFSQDAVKKVMPLLEEVLKPQPGFIRILRFLELLYELSLCEYRVLSTSSFAKLPPKETSRRVQKIKDHIREHYAEPLRLETLADMVGMAPTAFSRFFKTRTNQTISDYIIDIRLGHAIRCLIDTNMTCSEICYMCGFNNQSNFNRLFKKKKGCSPMEFRDRYLKTKIIV